MFNPVDSHKYVAPLELYLNGNNFAINMSPLWGLI